MIQPAKVNFNKAMLVVVLVFGLVSTLALVSDPLNPENDEIPTASKKVGDDMFATAENTLASSTRATADATANNGRTPASAIANTNIVATGTSQSAMQNPFGVNSSADGIIVDCLAPPKEDAAPQVLRAARIKIQLNNCSKEGLKIVNTTNNFEGLLFTLSENSAATDLINLVDKENAFEVSGPTAHFKFKVLNSLPHR